MSGTALTLPRCTLIASQGTEIALLDAVIADMLTHHGGYHALQMLPGIGPVLAQ